jgi:hypothetical protein
MRGGVLMRASMLVRCADTVALEAYDDAAFPHRRRPGALAAPAGIELAAPRDDSELYAMSVAQHEAFGEGPPDVGSVARHRAMLDEA